MIKPIIGVVSTLFLDSKVNKNVVSEDYINAIEKVNGIPLIIPVINNIDSIEYYLNICNGYLFTGGNDIHPLQYGKEPHLNLGEFSNKLDLFQIFLMKKIIELNKPFLAICRGIQVLNIACGGTLFQDLAELPSPTIQHYQKSERYDVSHSIFIEKNSTLFQLFGSNLKVNSFHHQCIDKLGDNLKITAKSIDNIIEALELENYNFGIGVQWHPEMMLANDDFIKPLFTKLIDASF